MIRHDSIRAFQVEHRLWLQHNFPDQERVDGLLGMVEEVGELAHAFLKSKQGIRTTENHEANIMDALGDILIYMASFCNTNNIDMAQCLESAWEEVKQRDWRADPTKGINTPHTELSTPTASSAGDEVNPR